MTKTIEEHLRDTLPPYIAEMAVRRTTQTMREYRVKKEEALKRAFDWNRNILGVEEFDYWNNINKQYFEVERL
jgi:hypothetical protein